jgi:predicted nucleotidyltransferase
MLAWAGSFVGMERSRLGGIARSRALAPKERSRIARAAAKARWARREAGVLQISEIRALVKQALGNLDAKAFLFGSYARGEATPDSDIDLMVIKKAPVENWLAETAALRRRMRFGKSLDLVVEDAASFARWKREYGTIQHEVAREGIRLV